MKKSISRFGKAIGVIALMAIFCLGLANVNPVNAQTATTTCSTLSVDLTIGSQGFYVIILQTFLEAKGLLVIPSGSAKGFFGELTRSSVSAYQNIKGIVPADGYVGPITRAAIMSDMGCNETTTQPPTPTSTKLDIKLSPTPSNNSNILPGNDIPVYGLILKSSELNSKVQTIDLRIDVKSTSMVPENPAVLINTIKVMDGTSVVSTIPVTSSTFVKDSNGLYYVRLAGLNLTLPKDTSKILTVQFSTNSLDSHRSVFISGYGANSLRTSTADGVINTFYNISLFSRDHVMRAMTTTTCYTYNIDLSLGSRGADVVALQTFLDKKGFLIMPTGDLKGEFDERTKSAVIAYQIARGITPADGYVGPITRAAIMASDCFVTTPPTPPKPTVPAILCSSKITRDLTVGSSGTDVIYLQTYLETKGFLAMQAGVDKGYFGPLTKTAITAYQVSKGISPADGYVGVVTRAAIVADVAFMCSTIPPIIPPVQPQVRVVAPNGGETVAQGESLSVIWTSANPFQPVDVSIYDSNGNQLTTHKQSNITPRDVNGQSIGFATASSGPTYLPLGRYQAKVCSAGTSRCDFSDNFFTVISPVSNVSPYISSVIPQPVNVGSLLTVNVANAGRSGNIILKTADGSKSWTNGFATDITNLNGFAKYDGSKLSFVIPSTIGRGVHSEGWWNEPVVPLVPGTYKLNIASFNSANGFINSNTVNVVVGNNGTVQPTSTTAVEPIKLSVISKEAIKTFTAVNVGERDEYSINFKVSITAPSTGSVAISKVNGILGDLLDQNGNKISTAQYSITRAETGSRDIGNAFMIDKGQTAVFRLTLRPYYQTYPDWQAKQGSYSVTLNSVGYTLGLPDGSAKSVRDVIPTIRFDNAYYVNVISAPTSTPAMGPVKFSVLLKDIKQIYKATNVGEVDEYEINMTVSVTAPTTGSIAIQNSNGIIGDLTDSFGNKISAAVYRIVGIESGARDTGGVTFIEKGATAVLKLHMKPYYQTYPDWKAKPGYYSFTIESIGYMFGMPDGTGKSNRYTISSIRFDKAYYVNLVTSITPNPIKVTAPNGGERYKIGSSMKVEFDTTKSGSSHALQLVSAVGAGTQTLIQKTIVGTGSFALSAVIPTTVSPGTYFVKICADCTSSGQSSDMSDAYIHIEAPTPVTTPTQGASTYEALFQYYKNIFGVK